MRGEIRRRLNVVIFRGSHGQSSIENFFSKFLYPSIKIRYLAGT